MNGKEIRPVKVVALGSRTVVSIRNGTMTKVARGDQIDGFINEYGNVYNADEQYIGSTPLDFEEVTQ